MTKRIAMWSGPRNISTAMMRSWENRADTQVVDEPFYACYLAATQSPHPCFDEILSAQSQEFSVVADQMCNQPCDSAIYYQKHMTHHMLQDIDLSWTSNLLHCFLIRDPVQVVSSYTNSRGVCNASDIGIIRQAELYQQISRISGQDIPVLDSNDVLRNPQKMLLLLCEELDVPFDASMLTWPAGRRDSDGVWASHWYHNVEKSTGFSPFVEKPVSLTLAQQAVVEEVMPSYLMLAEHKLG